MYFCSMWQTLRNYIPLHVQSLLLRLLAMLLLLTAVRILFYAYNSGSFTDISWTDWLVGMWFDLVTLALLFIPFIVLSLIPMNWQQNRVFRFVQVTYFHLVFSLILAFNLLDIEYFNYTMKRSTADLFAIVSAGNDIGQLLTSFIRDFWVLLVCFLVLLYFSHQFYKRTNFHRWKKNQVPRKLSGQLLWFVLGTAFFVLIGRGGWGLKPISPVDANLYTEPQNTALVLNSAFTVLKTYGQNDLEIKSYFKEDQAKMIFNPVHQTDPQHVLPPKTNVVIIMLESFGYEWIGTFNHKESYTPFLDSLLKESWTFTHGLSNGKKSIEAVPAIAASIPSWMDNPYISSAYGGNHINSLPSILSQQGYSTAFYHGATNGSMRFNSFTKAIGYDAYVGRFEYNNDAHFDRTWGILDEYFNPWTAKQLTKQKAPFFATLFTLSSHHPYYVPPRWRNKLKDGPEPICKSLHYGDISLKKFFEQAQKEPWYENTLFVLVGDHTPSSTNNFYEQRTQMYKIPIAFYHGGKKLPKRMENTIFQQIDIMPTVLDLLDIDTKYYSFGNSYFSKAPREGVAYLEGTYFYFYDNYVLYFSNDKSKRLVKFNTWEINPRNELNEKKKLVKFMERRLKAIIQRYNNDLLSNSAKAP